MSGTHERVNDPYIIGHGLAAQAIFTNLLRVLVNKRVLSKDEVTKLLDEAMAKFHHPMCTDNEMAAAGAILVVRKGVSQP
jgi:hypothetical protein